ncbi:response regulator [Spongiibacter sp. KMU-158]|uniref:Response regulator n=1 Tax=Spongiibacter pelagi TaxID=2760804 RepID=A0A927GX02_9GAMM|nr:response regulator [Spongiibacter pelagi]MBD2858934.1 response regulator [Spongiibacter pelagi]
MSSKTILMIEDDLATCFLHRMVLESLNLNLNIQEVYDGKEAIDYLSQHTSCPDLILLDINMPLLNGWEFLDAVAASTELCKDQAKIVILTTSLNPEDHERAQANPLVSGLIIKPLDEQSVKQVESYLLA